MLDESSRFRLVYLYFIKQTQLLQILYLNIIPDSGWLKLQKKIYVPQEKINIVYMLLKSTHKKDI